MSEYQHYEFIAVDRPLSEADQRALRALSTRARITATRFVNTYEWGDFKGDPAKLMERWFDLHLYWANWGMRRLMLRLPKQLVDLPRLERILDGVEGTAVLVTRDHVILDVVSEDEDPEEEQFEDGPGWLAALAPLRAELIAGDIRPLYLLWLTAVHAGAVPDEEAEPEVGMGPLTASLQSFADFLRLDPELVRAAAEVEWVGRPEASSRAAEAAVARLPEPEKVAFLMRLLASDPDAGVDLRRKLGLRVPREGADGGRP